MKKRSVMSRRGGAVKRSLAGVLVMAVWVAGAAAQIEAPPDEIGRLQEMLQTLGPQQRLEAIRELQEGRAGSAEAPSDSTGRETPVDDRHAPQPWGAAAAKTRGPAEEGSPDLPPRFGDALFDQSPETFQPPKFGPVPDDYRVAPGDEVVVEVWGEVSFRDRHVVDREGAVLLRDAGRTMVAGRTLADVRADVTRRLARVISGIEVEGGGSTFVDVSLGRLRSIRVFVVGEARRPGGYEVSSTATVFEALYAAAGPNELGSLRDVRLLREDRIHARLDLYEYLLEGTRSSDATLQDGDTVFIPVAAKTVTVSGEVRRPLRYELTDGEGLRDVVRMAGGLTPSARADLAHVERIVPVPRRGESGPVRVDLDVPLAALFDPSQPPVVLEDGDVVRVLAVTDRAEQYVNVAGSVASPGRYGYEAGMRVTDLLRNAGGLWRDAYLDHAVLVRVGDDYVRSSFSIGLSELVAGGEEDRFLAPMDSLHVFSEEGMQDPQRVRVFGAVRRPGSYPFHAGMSLQDLVLAADGLEESADLSGAEVSRLRATADGDSVAVLLHTPLGPQAREAANVRLENLDNLFVRRRAGWQIQRNVTLLGEVVRPGVYTLLSREERVSDVLGRAGGLLESAYAPGFRLTRAEVGIIGLDLEEALSHSGGAHDVVLEDGDRLEIPPVPSSVTVTGEVGHPTSVVHRSGKGIGYYVARAGGYTQTADRGRARVVLPNGVARQVKRFWPDPAVIPGSTIEVPAKQHTGGIDWGNVIVRTSQIAAAVATIFIATN